MEDRRSHRNEFEPTPDRSSRAVLVPEESTLGHFLVSLHNSWMNGLTQLIGFVASFAIGILLVRFLGPKEYGEYVFALGMVGVLFHLPGLALDTVATREVARNHSDAFGFLRDCISVKTGITIPIGVALSIIIGSSLDLSPSSKKTILYVAFIVALRHLMAVFYGVTRGMSRFAFILKLESFFRPLSLVVGGFLLWKNLGIQSFLIAVIVVEGIQIGFMYLGIRRFIPAMKDCHSWARTKYLIGSGIPLALAGVAHYANIRADALMLGLMEGEAAVGKYGMAFNIYLAAAVLLHAMSVGFLPSTTKLYEEKRSDIVKFLFFFLVTVGSGGVLFAIGMMLLGGSMLSVLYGQESPSAAMSLMILAIGVPFAAVCRAFGILLISGGLQRLLFYGTALAVFFHVCLDFWLIPDYGIVGAAISMVAADGIAFACTLVFSIRMISACRPVGIISFVSSEETVS